MLRGPMLKTVEYLTYDLGLDLRKLGLPHDQFGSVMITNVGMFGLPVGFAPLVPFSRVPILLTIGAIEARPKAVEGKVEIRPMVTVGATFDHRLLDGFQAGRIARRFRAVVEDPETALGAA
jgi:pyruvate dehydrogenase E2 component (dihydrolipoamide acetyltransferase)